MFNVIVHNRIRNRKYFVVKIMYLSVFFLIPFATSESIFIVFNRVIDRILLFDEVIIFVETKITEYHPCI